MLARTERRMTWQGWLGIIRKKRGVRTKREKKVERKGEQPITWLTHSFD